jgi:hypothetical protein
MSWQEGRVSVGCCAEYAASPAVEWGGRVVA